MKTLILIALLLSSLLLFQASLVKSEPDNSMPCCNVGNPSNCPPNAPTYGLFVSDGTEVGVSCQCCIAVYQYYGNPPNLTGISVPKSLLSRLGACNSPDE